MKHGWKPIKLGNSTVAHECTICEAIVGRHYDEWPIDEPWAEWVRATVGEECQGQRKKSA